MSLRLKFLKADFLLYSQAIFFSFLFAIWALPETILIRNLCLVLGGLIGIYQIYTYRTFFTAKKAIPIYLLFALFVWVTAHLLFLNNDFSLQLTEYQSIWKRSLIGVIFALGFGLGIVNSTSKVRQWTWIIFYLGLLLPTLIYMLRYVLLYYEKKSGVNVGAYWHIYIAKTAYMGFCIPALAVALGQIYSQITQGKWLTWINLIYVCTIPSVLFVFYAENIKNGVLYSFIFILIFIGLITYRYFKTAPVKVFFMVALTILVSTFFINNHIQKNHSWQTFFADARTAFQVENNEAWKCSSIYGLPKNDLGEQVSDTNYSRIAWGVNAAKLVIEYPLGYGLVERSFGHIGHQIWPGSCLTQSHSGWLDLTLGIGVPGMLLLFGSFIMSLRALLGVKLLPVDHLVEWRAMLVCVLICFGLVWCTTEISQKVFFDELLFFLALASGSVAGVIGGVSPKKSVMYE